MTSPPRTIHLVACSAAKLDRPAPARSLYTSPLFRKARRVAEAAGEWYVLSAAHHVVEPAQELEPYDRTLRAMNHDQREHWAGIVFHALMSRGLEPGDRVVFLAGALYARRVAELLEAEGVRCSRPLAGLGVGRMLQELDRMASTGEGGRV
jgi:hypothetical protein